jgi:hypothetical protein
MGVYHVDQEEPGPGYVKGPLGGGKIFFINLRGKGVKLPQGCNEFPGFLVDPPPVNPEKEAEGSDPKGDKIEIYGHPGGGEGDFRVQGMIHRRHGNPPRQQGRPVLAEKKLIKNGKSAFDGDLSQAGIGKTPEKSGSFCFVTYFKRLSDHAAPHEKTGSSYHKRMFIRKLGD